MSKSLNVGRQSKRGAGCGVGGEGENCTATAVETSWYDLGVSSINLQLYHNYAIANSCVSISQLDSLLLITKSINNNVTGELVS